jgi:hypothetical protein
MGKPVDPDRNLINRAFRIKPVLTDRDGHAHFIAPRDIYDTLFDMDGIPGAGRADAHIKKIGEIDILLPAGLWSGQLPGPTPAQVLPQIPHKYLRRTVAFEAHTVGDRAGENGFVRGSLTLFGGTLPQEIREQPVIAWKKTYAEPFPTPPKPARKFNSAAATVLKQDVGVLRPVVLRKPPAPGK